MVAGWLVWNSPLFNEAGRNRTAYEAIAGWARTAGMVENETLSKQTAHHEFPRRWLSESRTWWYRPSYGAARIRRELEKLAPALGLAVKKEPVTSRVFRVTFLLPGGREGLVMDFAPQAFVAIIIDDIGFSLKKTKRIAALPVRLTGAIIPLTPSMKESAEVLFASGKEVFLHMPMQPIYKMPEVIEYSMAIRTETTPAQAAEFTEKSIKLIPHIVGVNNHEGSLATENMVQMAAIMPVIKRHNLVFVDSGTTNNTIAWKAAQAAGLRWAKRNYFLDIVIKKPEVTEAFLKVIQLARNRGEAIAIGHPHEVTLEVLEEQIPKAVAEGIIFVGATQITRVK